MEIKLSKKQDVLFKAWSNTAIALALVTMPLWADLSNGIGTFPTILLSLIPGWFAFRCFKKTNTIQNDEELETNIPKSIILNPHAPIVAQIKFYKRWLIISLIIFPLSAILFISELNDLQSGVVENIKVWAPISFMYNQVGYWGAVLFDPILGTICIIVLLWKIISLKKELKAANKTVESIGK